MNFETLYDRLVKGEEKLAVIGLGYVGMPIAVEFSRHVKVIGFDRNEQKIQQYRIGIDPTHEVGDDAVQAASVDFTSEEKRLSEARFLIVAVPTPIKEDKTPDLEPLKSASRAIGRNIVPGSIVVYESTVYPGVTEEICVPIIEKESGLKCGKDWKIGYSPERINPGDREHRLTGIRKIAAGMDEVTLDTAAKVYEMVVEAGVYRASGIRVAEAAKVIENCQRDINIAFMNELSIIFHRMGIDTKEVLEAAETKWNFLPFTPGLVGGHCIGVDPYYLTYKADMLGYHSQMILSGRRINDSMGKYIAENCIKNLISADKQVKGARVAVLGFTFKENCPDTRNSKVWDIIRELKEYGIDPLISDPMADALEVKRIYGVEFVDMSRIRNMDAIILAVAHDAFKRLKREDFDRMYTEGKKVLLDVKGILNPQDYTDCIFWRL